MAHYGKDYTDERNAALMHIEQLNAYPEFAQSVRLAKQLLPLVTGHTQNTPAGSWADQCYRSATSISANIAEGVGRMMTTQIIQFLRIARGSAFETVSHLSLSPVPELDLSDLRRQYVNLIEQIDTSLLRLIDQHPV